MNLQALQEQRSIALDSARAIQQLAETESRELTADEGKKFDEAETQVRSLNDAIRRVQFLEDEQRSVPVQSQRRGNDGDFETRCADFSVSRAIAAQLEPGNADDGFEREVSAELDRRSGRKAQGIRVPHAVFQERRALLSSADGAALYPTRHRDDLHIDRLRESLLTGRLGATILTDLNGDQDIPRLSQSATAAWVGEHEAVTASEVKFDSVRLSPRTIGAETEYSRRMLINAGPSIEALLRNDLARVIAAGIDAAAVAGDGADGEPTGLLNISGVSAATLSAAALWSGVLSMISSATSANALQDIRTAGWLAHPEFARVARSTPRVSTGDAMVMEHAITLADYPFVASGHVPANWGTDDDEAPVIFGTWSDLIVGYWSSVDILVNPFYGDVYARGGVRINALQDVDIGVRHPESFVVGVGIKV